MSYKMLNLDQIKALRTDRIARLEELTQSLNLAGVRISSLALESEEATLKLNLSRGCYILKVGKTVRKVNVK